MRELKAQGIDVINADVGSPDLPPPPAVIEALALSAHRDNAHGYSGYRGLPAFREAVARYYQRRFNLTVDPERQVLPLLGSKEGIVNIALAYLDAGDVALVPEIGYPSYALGAQLAGAEVAWLPVDVETGLPDLNAVDPATLKRAKLLWVNYPNNPMGATCELAFYQEATDFCQQHNLLLASDNPYCDVTYDDVVAPSALQANGALDCGIEFISFSKTYNMAGWRLGAAVGCETAIERLLQVKSNVDSGHFIPIYEAGIHAIDETPTTWIEDRNAVYQRRRDKIMDVLPRIGLSAMMPSGALYIWARVTDEALDGATYAERALLEAHVSMAPGLMYGPGGAGYVRMSVCVPDARLDEALARLETWYASH